MPKQFVFFYLMADRPASIREAVPAHVAYWRGGGVERYAGGPFADRSGGLITFMARDLAEAVRIIDADPFVAGDLLESRWIKEWLPEPASFPPVGQAGVPLGAEAAG